MYQSHLSVNFLLTFTHKIGRTSYLDLSKIYHSHAFIFEFLYAATHSNPSELLTHPKSSKLVQVTFQVSKYPCRDSSRYAKHELPNSKLLITDKDKRQYNYYSIATYSTFICNEQSVDFAAQWKSFHLYYDLSENVSILTYMCDMYLHGIM